MPRLADLRHRLTSDVVAYEQPSSSESLVSDTRCQISPAQAVEQKLRAALHRVTDPRLGTRFLPAR